MSEAVDGLEGVVAARRCSRTLMAKPGRLVIRGHALESAGRLDVEEVAALLWSGFFHDLPEDFAPALGAARVEVFAEVAALDADLLALTPIEAMRALTARLPTATIWRRRWAGRRAGGVHRGGRPRPARRGPPGPRSRRRPRRRHPADDPGPPRRGGRSGGARRLPGHRRRPRAERLHLRRPRGGLDPRGSDLRVLAGIARSKDPFTAARPAR